jgi:ketosteroid isomerase-like protein
MNPMTMNTDLEARIRRLEDLEAIRGLAVRYGYAVDERDIDAICALFSPDGELRTTRESKGRGHAAIAEYYRKGYKVLGPTNHFTHGHIVDFDAGDPDRATGVVFSHAEVVRDGVPMVTAMRYHDTYQREAAGWRFRERVQSYMYFVDVQEYRDALASELRMRRAPGAWQPADWPAVSAG